MDAFIDTLIQLLIDWGYLGLFLSALLAGSIVPFSSELVLVGLVEMGLDPVFCVLSAALGNTAGGKKERIERIRKFLQGKGALMAFFSFLPIVGELISIALGLMRSNVWITTTAMFVGKLVRYIVILMALQGVISLIK